MDPPIVGILIISVLKILALPQGVGKLVRRSLDWVVMDFVLTSLTVMRIGSGKAA